MTRLPRPKVADPIIFRPMPDSPERVVRPCTGRHRELWLSGYMVVSCSKCMGSLTYLDPSDAPPVTPEGGNTNA